MVDESGPKARDGTSPANEVVGEGDSRLGLQELEQTVRDHLDDGTPWQTRAERFRLFCDSQLIGLISWSTSGKILDTNDAFLALTGYSRSEFLAGELDWEAVTPPEYLALDQAAAEELTVSGRCRPYEKEYARRDGTRVPVLVNCELVDAAHGLGVSYIVDLTERKRHEERLLRAQILDNLGALVGGTAHDFNNLLTTIVCNASVALNQLPAGHAARQPIEHIYEASQRAAELCAQMQSYSSTNLGGDVRELDIGVLTREICERARSMMSEGIELDLRQIADDLRVVARPDQLEKVVLALLSNACEAMTRGGTITVSASIGQPATTSKTIFATAGEDATRYVVVSVRDTGVGMDRETASRAFDPFYSTKFLGRGMGLAAAHGIVRAHGGLLEVESTPEAGTVVRILLPMADSLH